MLKFESWNKKKEKKIPFSKTETEQGKKLYLHYDELIRNIKSANFVTTQRILIYFTQHFI